MADIKTVPDELRNSKVLNPFTDGFDLEKLENLLKKNEYKDLVDELRFILLCSQVYTDFKNDILKTLKSIGLSQADLVETFFKIANKESLVISENISEMIKKHEFPNDSEQVNFFNIQNTAGENMHAGTAVELHVDILSELIKITSDFENTFQQAATRSTKVLDNLYRAWVGANIILNIRDSAYEAYLYDNALIKWETTSEIVIKKQLPQLDYLRSAAQVREHNLQMENFSYLMPFLKKIMPVRKSIRVSKIESGRIFIEQCTTEKQDYLALFESTVIKYHSYLSNVVFDSLKGITLREFCQICATIVELFNTVKKVYKVSETDDTLSNIPFTVHKRDLINSLGTCTGLKVEAIEQSIEMLCVDNNTMWFWSNPFYKRGELLFFPLNALIAPNINLYLDNIVNAEFPNVSRQESMFRDFILQELSSDSKSNYDFKVISNNSLLLEEDFFNNTIVIETKELILLFELSLYPYPVSFSEHEEVLSQLSYAAFSVKEKSKAISDLYAKKRQKETINAILTKYIIYSGLNMNGVPVIDYSLLLNYISRGNYSRGKMIFQDGDFRSMPFAEIPYYQNEKEFNAAFRTFLNHPTPVHMILNNLTTKEIPIVPHFLPFQIKIDAITHVGEKIMLEEGMDNLEGLLKYEYYITPKGDIKQPIENSINYNLSMLIHRVSLSEYVPKEERIGLFQALSKGKQSGQVYILHYLIKSLEVVINKEIEEDKFFEESEFEEKEIDGLFNKLYSYLEKGIRLSEFEVPSIYTKEDELKLISIALTITAGQSFRNASEEELNFILIGLTILVGLRKKYNIDKELYLSASNFIELLNYTNRYQRARDMAEEILLLAIKDNKHSKGWDILFNCYTHQMSIYDGGLYGALLFSSLYHEKRLSYHTLVNALFNSLKFFRNFGYVEFAKRAHEISKKFPLNEYDRQKFTLAYYSTLFKDGSFNNPELISEIFSYIDTNINQIKKYGEQGVIPWLGLLNNLKRLKEIGVVKIEINPDDYITKLKEDINELSLAEIEGKLFGAGEKLKDYVISRLIRIFETRDSYDFANEINHLAIPANNLLQDGILSNDLESILLASIILCDQSFAYFNTNHEVKEVAPFNKERDMAIEEKLKNYLEFVLKNIKLAENQALLFYFEFDKKVGYLMLKSDGTFFSHEIQNWNSQHLYEWTQNVKNFFFNHKNLKEYDLNAQEGDYKSLFQDFAYTAINQEVDFTEVLFCSTTELSNLPHNLIVYNDDFLSSHFPICNIFSFERHILKSSPVTLPKEFSVNCWIPIEDGDFTLSMGHGLLDSFFETYKVLVHTKRYPANSIEGDINIFMAHGSRENSGFKAVFTSTKESTIFRPASVFGKGVIAILFICNSGSTTEELYSNQIVSFSADLLKMGYESVIASFWPYDVTMAPTWLNAFMNSFKAGAFISKSVFEANKTMGLFNEETSQVFAAPFGRFAMHLYGNPNVFIEKSKM